MTFRFRSMRARRNVRSGKILHMSLTTFPKMTGVEEFFAHR
jgi:hypothetical protein